ncbi:MAG: 3-hydroxyacyl-CoA dehydrogenase family protein [Planctomycetota bacterium]
MSEKPIERVVVIGGGTMGHGIAQVAAAAGMDVVLADLSEDVLEAAIGKIRDGLERRVAKGKATPEEIEALLGRIATATDAMAAARDADVVVEAVPESLELKQNLFRELSGVVADDAILASNTSSISLTTIASAATNPERVIGAHFFNPVPVMTLLEVVRADQTSDATVERTRAFGERLGKEVIVVRDTPGFATSRLGVVLGLEAIRMLEQGVAQASDIDRALELGYRHPMGPLKLTDLVGLDVRLNIAEYLHEHIGGDQYAPPELMRKMVAEGKLGKKSGEGFYRW